jgi:hypothetical protein
MSNSKQKNPFDILCAALTMEELYEFCVALDADCVWYCPKTEKHLSADEVLAISMDWASSPQGYKYWAIVHNRLAAYGWLQRWVSRRENNWWSPPPFLWQAHTEATGGTYPQNFRCVRVS